MSAFRRKKYGKVKPVPKPKERPPEKPAVLDLRNIFSRIKKSPESQLNDLLSEALLWWIQAIPYLQWKYKKMPSLPLEAAKAFTSAQHFLDSGRSATTDKVKAAAFINALERYARYAAPIFKTPAIRPYLQKSKEVSKKTAIRSKQLTHKFDSLLTLLSQCFDYPGLHFGVQDVILDKYKEERDRKVDHTLNKIYYSREKMVAMKKQLFHKGLLSVVLEEADFIARALSLSSDKLGKGSFVEDPFAHLCLFRKLLRNFERFAGTTAAPKMLVKREKKRKVLK